MASEKIKIIKAQADKIKALEPTSFKISSNDYTTTEWPEL